MPGATTTTVTTETMVLTVTIATATAAPQTTAPIWRARSPNRWRRWVWASAFGWASRGAVGIDIDAGLLFREGDAALSDEARALLTEVAQLLRDRPHQIRVEGHTDSKPIANARHASNWELSSARAAVVVRQLASAGIAEIRMSAVGMAANRPLARNDTVEGRARNRRVHLVLLRQP